MKVLVTGAAGFVGASIVRYLARQGHTLVALVHHAPSELTMRFWGDAVAHIYCRTGDVTQPEAFRSLNADGPFDAVVHGAAMTPDPAKELANAAAVVSVNVLGTVNALQWAATQPALRRFVYLGSTNVYGGLSGVDLTEDLPVYPQSLYGITKLTCEQIVQRFQLDYGLPGVSTRITSVYGAAEQPSFSQRGMSFIHECTQMAFKRVPVAVANPDITHDWMYAEDLSAAVAALLAAERLQWPVYNLSSGQHVSAETVLLTFQAQIPSFRWTAVAASEANVAYPSSRRRPVPGRLQHELGFRCSYNIQSGLQHYLEECTNMYVTAGQ